MSTDAISSAGGGNTISYKDIQGDGSGYAKISTNYKVISGLLLDPSTGTDPTLKVFSRDGYWQAYYVYSGYYIRFYYYT